MKAQRKDTERSGSGFNSAGLKDHLLRLAYANPLYNLTLKTSGDISLHFVPNDPWPGNAEKGCDILNNAFVFGGQKIDMKGKTGLYPWEPSGASADYMAELHCFEWLRDLRSVGGDAARRKARQMISDWIQTYGRWHPVIWSPAILARRVSAWIGFYNFFASSADDYFRYEFNACLAAQAKHLIRVFPSQLDGLDRIHALKGVLYAHICLPISSVSEDKIFNLIEHESAAQIWRDGVHISRCPSKHLDAFMLFIDIRNLLRGAKVPVPNMFNELINKMAAALKFFRHGDGRLAVFEGGVEDQELRIDTALTQSGYKGKVAHSARQSGYARLSMGRTNIIMDIGPEGPDIKKWKSPNAIELSVGKQRLFVNCGNSLFESRYTDALKRSVAYSSLTIDEEDADFRNYPSFDVEPRNFTVHDMEGSCLIEASHAGYYEHQSIIHHRRLYMGQNGEDIRGEDILTGTPGHYYAIRFHLHPSIKASLIQDGYEVLLQPPKGAGFRFLAGGHPLKLEESLYLGDGETPRKTLQIVLEGQTIPESTALQWALYKEKK